MPLEKPIRITTHDAEQARFDQLQTLALGAGTVAGITGFNYRFNAPFGRFVQKGVQLGITGVEAKPTPTGRAAIRLPTASIFAGFLPQPVGYIPGEWMGLHPAVVRRTLGFSAGKKPVIFEPSEERKRVFDATITAERIGAKALGKGILFGRANGLPFGQIPPGPIDVSPEELDFLRSLPPGLTPSQALIPQLEARRSDLQPAPVPFLGVLNRFVSGVAGLAAVALPPTPGAVTDPVPQVSLQAEYIRPVNAAALANEHEAEGLRLALVQERADP